MNTNHRNGRMEHIWYSNVDSCKSRIFEISTLNFVKLYLQEYLELSERMVLSFWTFSELLLFLVAQRSHSATKCFMSTNFNLYNLRNIQRKSKFTTRKSKYKSCCKPLPKPLETPFEALSNLKLSKRDFKVKGR